MSLSFAPYAPPPDEVRAQRDVNGASASSWFASSPYGRQHPPDGYAQVPHAESAEAGPSSAPYVPQGPAWVASPEVGGYGKRPGAVSAQGYATRYSWRVDLLAPSAYLTPFPAILILLFETRNDFARIHAYQSLFLALVSALAHLLFLWSTFLQWLLLCCDLSVYGWLAYRTHLEADLLERRLLPIIGPLAERWVEEE